jgi:type VI secretion system protein ImpH
MMQTFGWNKSASVEEWLYAEGYRFDFFQALRLLQKIAEDRNPARPSAGRVAPAGSNPAALDAIQLRANISFSFPPGEVHQIEKLADAPYRAAVTANILSLAGALGPMPDSFAETLLDRSKAHDEAMRDFLDIFHHRLLLLLYQVRLRHRIWLEWSAPQASSMGRYTHAFAGILNLSSKKLTPKLAQYASAYAGALWHKPRSPVVLQQILSEAFGVSIRVLPMRGAWLPVEPDDQCRLGRVGNSRLGVNTYAGKRAWNGQGQLHLSVRSLQLDQFLALLPGGRDYASLADFTRFYINDQFTCRLHLQLDAGQSCDLRLGRSRLGWTSWLHGKQSHKKRPVAVRL